MKKILFIVSLIFLYMNYRHLNLGFLSLYSLDEYAFHGSLRTMYEGLTTLDIKKFFSFGFYSYGFSFFSLNLLLTGPFFWTENTEMTIYIPRLVTSFFAIATLYLIFKIARKHTDNSSAILISLILVSMPGFWKNGFWFHPDWMMTFFIVSTVYLFTKDEWHFKIFFWIGCITYGLALAVKIQAITFIPFILIYIIYDNLQNKKIDNPLKTLKIIIKTLLISLLVFLILNPYLIHPKGLNAFISSFIMNMESNATNHGLYNNVSIMDKINNAIDYYFLNKYIFISLVFIAVTLSFNIFKKEKSKSILNIVAVYFLINIIYLLLKVNKDWQHYYLTLFSLAPLLLIPLISHFNRLRLPIISSILIIQILTHNQEYYSVFSKGYHPEKEIPSEEMKKVSNSLVNVLKNNISKESHILIPPYIPFDFLNLDLAYQNIHIIYGPLKEDMLEASHYKDIKNIQNKVESFIILPKNSIYFNEEKAISKEQYLSYKNSLEIINNFNKNGDLGYKKFKENEYFYIWRKN